MPADVPGYIYAALVTAGGVLGYYKKGSVISLVAGVGFGAALAIGAWQVSNNSSKYALQLGCSSILAAVMGYRYYNGRKIMPAGIVCALSVAMVMKILLKVSNVPQTKISN